MDFCSSYNEIACYKFYVYILYILYLILFTPFYLTFNILLLHTFFTQDGRTPAELAQSRGYRDMAKLIIDEGMYFIIRDNNFVNHNNLFPCIVCIFQNLFM